MKTSFSIGEISELLDIPKSTLRYWESEGLIKLPRDDMNNYRRYNPNSFYTISDLAHYRCLRMSLQDMKKLPGLSPKELADSIKALDQDLDKKLQELYTAKNYINKKMQYIEEYEELCKHEYQEETPDYDRIYSFLIEDTKAWSIYIKEQYQSILLYQPDSNEIEMGLAVPTSKAHPVLWSRKDNISYVSFVLKVDYSNPTADAFKPHLKYFQENGCKVSSIFARYLFSACDDKYYDYYKAFAELQN